MDGETIEATTGLGAAPKASVGRIVHYVLPMGSPNCGEDRPAIIAQVWNDAGMSNLSVFKGQSFDFTFAPGGPSVSPIADSGPVVLLGSVSVSAEKLPGTWHWPERD